MVGSNTNVCVFVWVCVCVRPCMRPSVYSIREYISSSEVTNALRTKAETIVKQSLRQRCPMLLLFFMYPSAVMLISFRYWTGLKSLDCTVTLLWLLRTAKPGLLPQIIILETDSRLVFQLENCQSYTLGHTIMCTVTNFPPYILNSFQYTKPSEGYLAVAQATRVQALLILPFQILDCLCLCRQVSHGYNNLSSAQNRCCCWWQVL